jgi:hypothetical protein
MCSASVRGFAEQARGNENSSGLVLPEDSLFYVILKYKGGYEVDADITMHVVCISQV